MSQRKLRVGFIGAGYIADWHAKAVQSSQVADLVAVCDANFSRAQSFAEAYGIAPYRLSSEMFSTELLDAVHVLTPPDHHFPTAREAVDAGLAVLLEKPMCATSDESAAVVALKDQTRRAIAVSHNSLFWPIFERAKDDIASGLLGRVEQVDIVWKVELGQIRRGPFDIWMLRQPVNLLLEIGPHPISLLLALAGTPDSYSCRAFAPSILPGGKVAYRRWEIQASAGATSARVSISLGPSFPEQSVFIRGTLGTATIDYSRNTYIRTHSTPYGLDFDRFFSLCSEGKSICLQGAKTLLHYGLSKLKLSRQGSPYGWSICRALDCFYRNLDSVQDQRLSPSFGAEVVDFCLRLGEDALSETVQEPDHDKGKIRSNSHPNRDGSRILVLGGTGFIGRHLVRRLLHSGKHVRLMTRQGRSLPDEFNHPHLEVFSGSMTNRSDLERALDGVKHVYHLARAEVKARSQYMQLDVEPTCMIGELCAQLGIERLIYTGTIDSYYAGARAGTITEQTPLDRAINRRNDYAWAKAQAENCLMELYRNSKLPLVIVRPGIVIGSGGNPFHWGVGLWSGYAVCRLWGSGRNKLPFVLVEDVANALYAALDKPGIEGESFNLIDEPLLTAREYCEELSRFLEMRLDVKSKPIWKFYTTDMAKWIIKCMVRHPERRMPSYRDWESRTQKGFFDCTKASQILGWQPASDRDRLIHDGIKVPAKEFLS